jgi:VWFA-related protein
LLLKVEYFGVRQRCCRFSSVVLTTTQIRLACGTGLFLSASIALAQAPEGPMTPRPNTQVQQTPPDVLSKLTARVTLVTTPVTVRDSRGAMIHDLEQQDFLITDNGVAQKITHFDVGGDPLSIVMVVETSTRIDPMLSQLRKLGILFTEQVMGPEAEAAVIGFDDSVHRLQGFTRNHDSVESVFAGLKTNESGHRLFDAMAEGVEMLSDRRKPTAELPVPGRRVLLVVSEALDSGSESKLGEVLRQAQLQNITIFSIGLSTTRAELQSKPRDNAPVPITPPGIMGLPAPPGTVNTPTSEANRNAGIDLIALAQVIVEHTKSAATQHSLELGAIATGGSYYSTFKGRSIESALDEIGGELHSQYMLSYSPPRSDAGNDFGYHEIVVSLAPTKSQGKKISSRPGYYIPDPER